MSNTTHISTEIRRFLQAERAEQIQAAEPLSGPAPARAEARIALITRALNRAAAR